MEIFQIHKKLLLNELVSMPLVNYEPASLKEWNTGWQIEYRVINPNTSKLEEDDSILLISHCPKFLPISRFDLSISPIYKCGGFYSMPTNTY